MNQRLGHQFVEHQLEEGLSYLTGTIPSEVFDKSDSTDFEQLWGLHPDSYQEAMIHGRKVKMPRWVRAYEKDYPYSNQVAKSVAAPALLKRFLDWSQQSICPDLNGILVNWHDGSLGHRHGKHRDSESGLVPGRPIITVSLGEDRVFRLRRYPQSSPRVDVILQHGDFVVIPWETNRHWTHEVPRFKRYQGKRISVTMRAFR